MPLRSSDIHDFLTCTLFIVYEVQLLIFNIQLLLTDSIQWRICIAMVHMLAQLHHYAGHILNTSSLISFFCVLPILTILYNLYSSQKTRPRGCRSLGVPPGQSHLHDEFDPKYTQGVPEGQNEANGQPAWRIKALFTYPIKSCAGVELDVANVVPTGLEYDRHFCFAEYVAPKQQSNDDKDMPRWTARTLRDAKFNRMALIRSEIWVPDATARDYAPELDEVKSQGVMVVSYPRVLPSNPVLSLLVRIGTMLRVVYQEHSFQVPLSPPPDHMASYPSLPVKIWKDSPKAYDYGQHIPRSLREYLGSGPGSPSTRLTLFRVNPSHHREIFRNAPRKDELGFQPVTGFADAYPIHLLNLASVHDVAARCAADTPRLSIRRFRANIITQGPEAFAEDHWKRVMVGGVEVHTVCRTVRCRLPNVDPDTGIRHPSEPDRTLKSYRRIDRGELNYACLGMQLVPSVQREFLLPFF